MLRPVVATSATTPTTTANTITHVATTTVARLDYCYHTATNNRTHNNTEKIHIDYRKLSIRQTVSSYNIHTDKNL